MQRTWLYKRYIVLAASTPNNRYAFLPDVLPAHLPERERSCVSGRTGLSCLRIRCGLFRRKYSINSLVYWVTYVHNVVYSFYRSM
ncbi:hypothetical protein, partial [Bacteroides ovatus]|uniref:hypothetical protein n=1 Tax=Bacteroides ovatus TaxID=28116 RepID=UPI001E5E151B